ncbi:MAG: DEAD/DEAH box helicase [Solirubrobacteraceae bacterium]
MTEILLTDDYARRQAARAVPGSWYSKAAGGYVIEDPTPRAAAVALKLFPHLIAEHPELLEIRAALAQDVRPIDCATPYYEQMPGDPVAGQRVWEQLRAQGKDYYEYQIVDLWYASQVLHQHGAFYLGWDRGLGKTLGTCALIDELDCRRTLVVCPNTAKQSVWAAELKRWCPWVRVVVLPNDKPKRERVMRWVADHSLCHDAAPLVLVIHYEAVNVIAKERAAKNGWKRYGEWDLVVADECHRISNPDAMMTRQLKRIPSRRRLALSGSVIQNHAEELFSQLQWLYPDRYSSKWRDWNDRYLDYVDSGYANVCVGVRIERLAELRDELGRFMVYRRKEDELPGLPARTVETRLVELSPRQRKAYQDLADFYIADLGDNESPLKASDGLTLLTRLRQVATGLDLVSGELADSSKQDVAAELIEDNADDAFVVFSWFKAAAESLARRLGEGNCFVVTGDTPNAKRADYIARFQAGERRVFIGTISTLGESVTLHRANNAIFLDRSWNPAANEQAEDRIYRIGQSRPVTVTHLVATDTVDETSVAPALTDKTAMRQMILGGRRQPGRTAA